MQLGVRLETCATQYVQGRFLTNIRGSSEEKELSTSLTPHEDDDFLTILSKKEELVYVTEHDRQAALIATGRVGCARDLMDQLRQRGMQFVTVRNAQQ